MGIRYQSAKVIRESANNNVQTGRPGIDFKGEQPENIIVSDWKVKINDLSGVRTSDGKSGEQLQVDTKAYGTFNDLIQRGDIIVLIDSGFSYKITSRPVYGKKYLVMRVEEV